MPPSCLPCPPARDSLQQPVYSVPSHSAASTSSGMERPKMSLATYTPYAIQARDTGLAEGQRHSIWDRRPAPQSLPHDPNVRRSEGRAGYVGGSGGASELGAAPRGSNAQQAPDEALTDEMFGAMAPCWRLLERAKGYMDKVMVDVYLHHNRRIPSARARSEHYVF